MRRGAAPSFSINGGDRGSKIRTGKPSMAVHVHTPYAQVMLR